MEQSINLLDMLIQPGFIVRNFTIIRVNGAAQTLLLEPGQDVRPLFATGLEEYGEFSGGCLYLHLRLGELTRGASVLKTQDGDLFLLDQEAESRELQALALAAQTLRLPMGNAMIAADQITAAADRSGDPQSAVLAGQLNRGLEQLLRVINNMSDTLLYQEISQQEEQNITALFEELFEKARVLLERSGHRLSYEGPPEAVFCCADPQQLERAVLNILSNAAKFTPAGGTIHASLTRRGRMLRLSVSDSGPGIREDILGQVFQRYLRRPGIEDSRFGLGLGLALVRAAAGNHGGTVLIDQKDGTRITMTMALDHRDASALRSPVFRVDYAGGRDHALVELADILPAELFQKK